MIVKLEDTPLASNRIGRVISPINKDEVRINSYVEILSKNKNNHEVYMYGKVIEIIKDDKESKLEILDKMKVDAYLEYQDLLIRRALEEPGIDYQLGKVKKIIISIIEQELELKGLLK